MSKADEMFEKLGYNKIADNSFAITYEWQEFEIQFSLGKKTIEKAFYNSELNTYNATRISMQELQAINEKCKEMGWVDE